MSDRQLNDLQHACLDRVAARDAYAVVTGWDAAHHAPIVEASDGVISVAAVTGRLNRHTPQ